MIKVKDLTTDNISSGMLLNFNHHQIITEKWVNRNNKWELLAASDSREWNKDKRIWITDYFRQMIERCGSVVAAYS